MAVITYIILLLFIATTVLYALWVYYGSKSFQCTVSDNPYCQRLKCESYNLNNDIPGLNSQPDPQNQYALSIFYSISLQSESANPKQNGFPGGLCSECNNCANCYNPELPVVDTEDKNENSSFKALAVNVVHNNLLRQAKYMCSKIIQENIQPLLVEDCISYFGVDGSDNPTTIPILNKKLIENMMIITNFNYYTYSKDNLNVSDGVTSQRLAYDYVKFPTCISSPCSQVYTSIDYTRIEYGADRQRLKPGDLCSKCDSVDIPNQYKLYLENPNLNVTNFPIDYKLYSLKSKIAQV